LEIVTDVHQDRDWKRKDEKILSEIVVASWALCNIPCISVYELLIVIATDAVSHFPPNSSDNLEAKYPDRLPCDAEEH
jgi:hypothetical protein